MPFPANTQPRYYSVALYPYASSSALPLFQRKTVSNQTDTSQNKVFLKISFNFADDFKVIEGGLELDFSHLNHLSVNPYDSGTHRLQAVSFDVRKKPHSATIQSVIELWGTTRHVNQHCVFFDTNKATIAFNVKIEAGDGYCDTTFSQNN